MYVVTQGRKLYGMPTDFGFCIKVRILPGASELLLGPPSLLSLHPALPHGDGRRHLVLKADVAPGSFLSPQPNKLRNGHKGLRLFCTEDERSRSCWLAAFRLFKVRSWHWLGG